jgi:hypothetical protein
MNFDEWYAILRDIANGHGESVGFRDDWTEAHAKGKSAEEAFYDEYPEHYTFPE